MIDHDLHGLMPAERRLSPERKQQIKEQLMRQVQPEPQPAKGGRGRRVAAGLAAAAVLATGGIAAAGAFGGPDAEQVAQVIENSEDASSVHLDGWRPALRAESVACIGSGQSPLTDPRESGNTSASEFPLEEMLTAEHLVEECTAGTDWARVNGGFDPEQPRRASVTDATRSLSSRSTGCPVRKRAPTSGPSRRRTLRRSTECEGWRWRSWPTQMSAPGWTAPFSGLKPR